MKRSPSQKLIAFRLLKQFSLFQENRIVIAVLTKAIHVSSCCTRSIKSTIFHPLTLMYILILFMQPFITVNDTTCIKSAKLKTWQHVSATTSYHQAKDRTKSCGTFSDCALYGIPQSAQSINDMGSHRMQTNKRYGIPQNANQ